MRHAVPRRDEDGAQWTSVYYVNAAAAMGQDITEERLAAHVDAKKGKLHKDVHHLSDLKRLQQSLHHVEFDEYFELGIPGHAAGWWTCSCPEWWHKLLCEHVYVVQWQRGEIDLNALCASLKGRAASGGRPQKGANCRTHQPVSPAGPSKQRPKRRRASKKGKSESCGKGKSRAADPKGKGKATAPHHIHISDESDQ